MLMIFVKPPTIHQHGSIFLHQKVEEIVLFLLEQQGVLAHILSDNGQEHQNLLQQSNSSKTYVFQEDYRNVGRGLLRLLNFVEVNATSLRKILKKFYKRFLIINSEIIMSRHLQIILIHS